MSLQKKLLKERTMASGTPPLNRRPLTLGKGGRKRDYSPLGWETHFHETRDVPVTVNGDEDCTFRVYFAGTTAQRRETTETTRSVFVFLHGGGHSALSWALFASCFTADDAHDVMAYDCRGHGQTVTGDDARLSTEQQVGDAVALIDALYGSGADDRPVVLVGHSMGGAIASHLGASGRLANLVGLVVIDVVEGTALAALPSMRGVLANRPKRFPSVEKAIEWSVRSRTLRNVESARVSIPPQLRRDRAVVDDGESYVWRTNLVETEQYWKGWFEGLSELFLRYKGPKQLILAGTDRLDTALTVAQMQGLYHLVLLPSSGHVIQEDAPESTSAALQHFAKRNRL